MRHKTLSPAPSDIVPSIDRTPKGSKISPKLSHELGPSVQLSGDESHSNHRYHVNHAYQVYFTDQKTEAQSFLMSWGHVLEPPESLE